MSVTDFQVVLWQAGTGKQFQALRLRHYCRYVIFMNSVRAVALVTERFGIDGTDVYFLAYLTAFYQLNKLLINWEDVYGSGMDCTDHLSYSSEFKMKR